MTYNRFLPYFTSLCSSILFLLLNFLLTDGRDQSISLVITTNDSETIEAIKDGFLQVFEHVAAQAHPSISSIAPLPVGFSAGVKGAQHRIANLVRGKKVLETQVIIGIEEMISEILPGK